MNDEITRLRNILQKLKDPQVSLKECKNQYQSAKIDWDYTFDKAIKKEELVEGELKLKILEVFFLSKVLNNIGVIGKGEERKQKLTQLSDEQFDALELVFNEITIVLKNIYLKWNLFSEEDKKAFEVNFIAGFRTKTAKEPTQDEVKEVFEELGKFLPNLKSERNRREQLKQNSSLNIEETFQDSNYNSSNSQNSVDIQSIQSQLKDLQAQVSKLTNNSQSSQNNSSELDQIKRSLNQLAKQIKDLDKKTSNEKPPQLKSQLNNLKTQQERIRSQLNQKQEQSSSTKDNNQTSPNQSSTSNDKFNWLYVVIPGGVLILAMAVIIAYLLGKRNKNER